jgi:hypothetical protein
MGLAQRTQIIYEASMRYTESRNGSGDTVNGLILNEGSDTQPATIKFPYDESAWEIPREVITTLPAKGQ